MLSEHIQLLIRRESKEVLGRGYANLWLLTLMLAAMFISIAFSNGSLDYLSYKMNDPFTNWVNISNGFGSSQFERFHRTIEDPAIQEHYRFSDVQADKQFSLTFIGKGGASHYLQNRFFGNIQSPLVQAILSEDNVVGGCAIDIDRLDCHTVGFIITEDALAKLGYTPKTAPAYIYHLSSSVGADTLGVELIDDIFAPAPFPVLGVVKRLPGNMDMIAARYFFEQFNNDQIYPFDLNNREYQRSLIFFADGSVDGDMIKRAAIEAAPDSLKSAIGVVPDTYGSYAKLATWKHGQIYTLVVDDVNLVSLDAIRQIAEGVTEAFRDKADVKRLYDYNGTDYNLGEYDFLSVNFATLDSIRPFETYAKDGFNVQIEMSQVNAKENFNAVSIMANILSWAMIVFSMVCIIMFIINMLQSYFVKVKRNLGTFKAFGMSTQSLISVYALIIVCILLCATVLALAFTWGTQELLPLLGIMKDGEFNYLSLWSSKTLWASAIVIVATLATVRLVMGRMLRSTPGDLIYDRN